MDTGGTRDIVEHERHGTALDVARRARGATSGGCGRTRRCGGASARRRGGRCEREFDARGRRRARRGALRWTLGRAMRVALGRARSVFPLHGYGGLERHVYDLARALAERDVDVTLITQPPLAGQAWSPRRRSPGDPRRVRAVPHVPLRRTARHDGARSEHGVSALRAARRAAGARARRARRGGHRPRLWRERARLRAAARAQDDAGGPARRRRWC